MAFNLITEAWLPVRCRDGTRKRISPWDLTDNYVENPVQSLDCPRPDFEGALAQFLVGLAQTCCPPKDVEQWAEQHRTPPVPEVLRKAMLARSHAFELEGDGPRFLQDLELKEVTGVNRLAINALLIDAATESAAIRNTDVFIKRGMVGALCPACAASALMTMQANAPAGGAGIRTSLRGGGPLTTLVLGGTLWETVWNNVLDADGLDGLGCDTAKPEVGGVFPWLAPTLTSEKKGQRTLPADVHPLHMYWGMPRRVRLLFDEAGGACDLCGEACGTVVREFLHRKGGYNYEGPWKHPLTPYTRAADGATNPRKGQPEGIGYRHWLGLVREVQGDKFTREPALCVRTFLDGRLLALDLECDPDEVRPDFRLWACGFDMDNMKARAWIQAVMPILDVGTDIKAAFETHVQGLIEGAQLAAYNLRRAVAQALFDDDKAKDVKPGTALADTLVPAFWHRTGREFFASLRGLRKALAQGEDTLPVRQEWHGVIRRACEELFGENVGEGQWARRPGRAAHALLSMRFFNGAGNQQMADALGLPKEGEAGAAKA